MSTPIKCKTLLGTWGLNFSITCLKSFVQHSEQEIQLEIFEDGTLTQDNKKQLLSAFPTCILIDKTARDQVITDKLAKYPSCLNLETIQVMHKNYLILSCLMNRMFFILTVIFCF